MAGRWAVTGLLGARRGWQAACRAGSGAAPARLHTGISVLGEPQSEAERAELGEYPVTCEVDVQWGEMDCFHHVNNTIYFKYFEASRIAYFTALGAQDFVTAKGVGPILAQTECKFIAPVSFPDSLAVGVRVLEMQPRGFLQEYKIFSRAMGRTAAVGKGRIVTVDYSSGRPVAVPEAVAAAITQLEGWQAA